MNKVHLTTLTLYFLQQKVHATSRLLFSLYMVYILAKNSLGKGARIGGI